MYMYMHTFVHSLESILIVNDLKSDQLVESRGHLMKVRDGPYPSIWLSLVTRHYPGSQC